MRSAHIAGWELSFARLVWSASKVLTRTISESTGDEAESLKIRINVQSVKLSGNLSTSEADIAILSGSAFATRFKNSYSTS